jgi:hypothetical protein
MRCVDAPPLLAVPAGQARNDGEPHSTLAHEMLRAACFVPIGGPAGAARQIDVMRAYLQRGTQRGSLKQVASDPAVSDKEATDSLWTMRTPARGWQ